MQISPHSSPMTLVFSRLTSPRNSKANIGSRGANETGMGKCAFLANQSPYSSETVQNTTKVTMTD